MNRFFPLPIPALWVLSIILATLGLYGCTPTTPPQTEAPKPSFTPLPLRREVMASSLHFVAYDSARRPFSAGTGVLLDSERILTAYHVVRGAAHIYVTYMEPKHDAGWTFYTYPAQLSRSSPRHDLALLRFFPDEPFTPLHPAMTPVLSLAKDPLGAGRQVFVQDRHPEYGQLYPHPDGGFLPPTPPLRVGVALSPTQVNVSGQPGSSGSGVFVIEPTPTGERYVLAGLIVTRTDHPPTFHERRVIPLPQGQRQILNVYLSGRWTTNIVPVSVLREFLTRAQPK